VKLYYTDYKEQPEYDPKLDTNAVSQMVRLNKNYSCLDFKMPESEFKPIYFKSSDPRAITTGCEFNMTRFTDIVCGFHLENVIGVSKIQFVNGNGDVWHEFLYRGEPINFNGNEPIDLEIVKTDNDINVNINALPVVALCKQYLYFRMDGKADVYFHGIQLSSNHQNDIRSDLIHSHGIFRFGDNKFKFASGEYTKIN